MDRRGRKKKSNRKTRIVDDAVKTEQIIFRATEETRDAFKTRTETDCISMSRFLSECVQAYIGENKRFAVWFDTIMKKMNRKPTLKRKRFLKRKKAMQFNRREVEGIFDILEQENPDL